MRIPPWAWLLLLVLLLLELAPNREKEYFPCRLWHDAPDMKWSDGEIPAGEKLTLTPMPPSCPDKH